MEDEIADRPAGQGWITRASSDSRLVACIVFAVVGGVASVVLTWATNAFGIFDQKIDLSDEFVMVGIPVAGAIITGLAYFSWHLARAPFRQRNEARKALFTSRAEFTEQMKALGKLLTEANADAEQ